MAIDVDGDVDFLHDRIGTLGEPAAPHLVAHDFSLTTSYSGQLFRLLAVDRRNDETPHRFRP
jgi:hypothetical protein